MPLRLFVEIYPFNLQIIILTSIIMINYTGVFLNVVYIYSKSKEYEVSVKNISCGGVKNKVRR